MSKRFTITSKGPRGRARTERCDDVVEAWNWYAYFTASGPLNEVEMIDHEEDVEARPW